MSNPRHNLSPADSQRTKPRSKRAQVVRACDSCRQHRVKCDTRVPCSNCNARGARCSNVTVKALSPPEAYREIERLRLKVQDLEKKLEQGQGVGLNRAGQRLPTVAQQESLSAAIADDHGSHDGIYTHTGRSGTETWYGVSSLVHFIGRVSSFLASSTSRSYASDELMNHNSSSTLLDEPARTDAGDNNMRREEQPEMPSDDSSPDISLARDFLSPMHEEYFLGLYWASCHTSVFPILDEAEFKKHYRSLCSPQGNERLPSALVDIVVAICIQTGTSSLSKEVLVASHTGTTVPGRQYYLRAQQLLAYELENPTISTLQCQILSCVYLCSSTFHNMCDSTCAAASRTAYILGLHVDPPESATISEKEMRSRLWWALFIMDTKIGIKYGRPFSLHWTTNLPPRLPEDDLEAASRAGSELTPLGNNLSWLSFHREHSKLFLVARSTYNNFCNSRKNTCSESCQYVTDSQAEATRPCLDDMEAWAAAVPRILQTERANKGRPLSTDNSDLVIDPFSPLWLQRQRLILELIYHNLCANICRPCINLGPRSASDAANQPSMKCVWHSMAITRILHQVLKSTSILTGWHEAFQWQWSAAMTLAGFVLACPQSESAPAARKSLEESVANLDDFGRSIAVAANAANIVRKVQSKIDQAFCGDVDSQGPSAADKTTDATITVTDTAIPYLETPESTGPGHVGFEFDWMADPSFQDVLNMASNVDQYADPDMLWDMADFVAQ